MTKFVTVGDLVEGVNAARVISGQDFLDRKIKITDVSRPALELTGYFNYYANERVQVLGRTEISFMAKMSPEERKIICKRLSTDQTPCYLVSRDLKPPEELVEVANSQGIPILGSYKPTTRIMANMTNYLEKKLADRMSQHGVLVDVYGMGTLIIGDSGIGKSETALELIKRGHRLIADDRVDLYMLDESRIVGEPPEILRNLIEIRGIGVIDVVNLFGLGAIRPRKKVDLVINLEPWNENRHYDRIGDSMEKMKFFNVDIPMVTVPVRVGRNLSIIIEIAAMNRRAKNLGYDAVETFQQNLTELMKRNSTDL